MKFVVMPLDQLTCFNYVDKDRCWGEVNPCVEVFNDKGKVIGYYGACEGHANEIEGGKYCLPNPRYPREKATKGSEVQANT